jgi:hypothetical protein
MTRLYRIISLLAIASFGVLNLGNAQQLPQLPPNQTKQLSAEQKAFFEKHKYTFELMRFVNRIGEIDKNKKYTLTQHQAKKVLEILKPLRTSPKLTQEQARQTLANLKKVFTATQLNAMSRIKPRFTQIRRTTNKNDSQPPREQYQDRKNDRKDIGRRQPPDFKLPEDFNPFYTKVPKGDKVAEERVRRMNEFFATLEKKVSPSKK